MTKLLLTAPFKPYGVHDGYAEALGMQMELLNNQITREQGVHSPRANAWTFGLYFLAENIAAPTTVLDFPSWRVFCRELRNGYTHVGISFIQTNVLKVKRMAEHVRRHFPHIKILLGGHGTNLPDLAELVPHDAACRGEGIRWLRAYLGEKPEAPLRHPLIRGVATKHVYGVPANTDDSAVLFPGLGCENRCFFCSTSSHFDGRYVPLLPTGRRIFETCRQAEEQFGIREFAIIDENLFSDRERAVELLDEMEKHGKAYNFAVFSSARDVAKLGTDFLVRLGVCFLWIGIETEAEVFEKMRGIDTRRLVRGLQAKGISVVSSSILFMEHHDRTGLERDIEWAIEHGSDFHQFMQLTPLPGTPLFEQYAREGRLIPEFPYTKMSGQNVLNFYHPHFAPEEAREITRAAFRRKYLRHGPGILKMAHTALRGYRQAVRDARRRAALGMSWDPRSLRYVRNGHRAPDRFMQRRVAMLRARAMEFRPILWSAALFAPHAAARRKCRRLIQLQYRRLAALSLPDALRALALAGSAAVEWVRLRAHALLGSGEFVRQPPTRRIEYRNGEPLRTTTR